MIFKISRENDIMLMRRYDLHALYTYNRGNSYFDLHKSELNKFENNIFENNKLGCNKFEPIIIRTIQKY